MVPLIHFLQPLLKSKGIWTARRELLVCSRLVAIVVSKWIVTGHDRVDIVRLEIACQCKKVNQYCHFLKPRFQIWAPFWKKEQWPHFLYNQYIYFITDTKRLCLTLKLQTSVESNWNLLELRVQTVKRNVRKSIQNGGLPFSWLHFLCRLTSRQWDETTVMEREHTAFHCSFLHEIFQLLASLEKKRSSSLRAN